MLCSASAAIVMDRLQAVEFRDWPGAAQARKLLTRAAPPPAHVQERLDDRRTLDLATSRPRRSGSAGSPVVPGTSSPSRCRAGSAAVHRRSRRWR
ncbi:hypothetical protein [Streptomyces sp. 3213.3]|uniref:hypothetical protein n=1 Tax=Streptomyces sp. 3213.3 TaxID=1855348 RepID=UPI00135BED98|nr:hypothetical protein [Streptomyces sp. 3213.3]